MTRAHRTSSSGSTSLWSRGQPVRWAGSSAPRAGSRRVSVALAALLGAAWLHVIAAAPALAQPAPDQATRAADDARARELYILGDEFYANGRYEAAEEAFAEAYRLSGRPLLLFNLANAQERSGRWREAADNLRSYREHAPEEELSALDARIGALERRIADRDAESRDEPVVVIQHESADLPRLTTEALAQPRPPLRPERILLPSAGVLALASLGLGLRVRSVRADVRQACVREGGQRLCLPSAEGAITRDRRLSLAADLLGAASLATAALGVWRLVHTRRAAESDGSTLRVSVGFTGAGVWLRGAF